jgi:hypothetical protein
MKRKALLSLVFLFLLISTAAAQRPATAPASAPIEIPFEMVTRHIVLKIKVNNSRPLSFVFDTGDKVGIIDLERAKELGLKLGREVQVGGAGAGQLAGAMVEDSSWSLVGLENFSQPIRMALPFGNLASRFGHDFDGIIGGDFIKEFVVEVDYQARVLKLHQKDKFSYTGRGETLPLEFNNIGYPTIEATVTPIGGTPIKGRFLIDLGSGGTLALHSPFVNSNNLLKPELKTIKSIGAGGAGGQVSGHVGRVGELSFGSFKIARPTTLFSQDKGGAFASSQLAGNIGQQIMGKFKIFLDYGRSRIILEPNKTFADPYDRAYAGFALRAEDKSYRTFRVTDILDDSPAAEAGLQKDDVIIRIDGHQDADLTLTKLNEMFEQPVSRKVTVRRGEQTLQLTITPKKLI